MIVLNNILRKYKDLEGQNILGKIVDVQRFDDYYVLFKFYDENCIIQDYNYPPMQEFINLKIFFKEDLLDPDLEDNFKLDVNVQYPMKRRFAYLYLQEALLKLNGNTLFFEEDIYKKYLNNLILLRLFKRVEKRFEYLWKKPINKIIFLKRIRKFFLNRTLTKLIENFFVGGIYIRIFLKKFLFKIILKAFKMFLFKSIGFPLILQKSKYSYRGKCFRKLYVLPGFSQKIISNLKTRNFVRRNIIRNGLGTSWRKWTFFRTKFWTFVKEISPLGDLDFGKIKGFSDDNFLIESCFVGKSRYSLWQALQTLKRKQMFLKKKFNFKKKFKGKRNLSKKSHF